MDFIQTPRFISVLPIILQSSEFYLTQTVCKQNYSFTFFNLQSATEIGDRDDQLSFFQTTCGFWRKQNIPLLTYNILLLLLSRFSRVRLCNPIDSSPPGSAVPGILQARTLEWAAIAFSDNILLGNYYSRQVLKNDLGSSHTAYDPMEIS